MGARRNKDLLDLKRGVLEAITETSGDIYVTLLKFNAEESIINTSYNEVEKRKLDNLGTFACRVDLSPVEPYNSQEQTKYSALFDFAALSFENKGVVVNEEFLKIMLGSYILFSERFYRILKVRPTAYFSGEFLKYQFLCIEELDTSCLDLS